MIKLTESELIEINLLIAYYGSLDLDNDTDADSPEHAEQDTLNALRKLMKIYCANGGKE